ncbi:MAG: AraC family transcriptional regulator [Chitinophagales bacterium]|nr:AraC family transcriptional regulator [Chitinophagales bacterium]
MKAFQEIDLHPLQKENFRLTEREFNINEQFAISSPYSQSLAFIFVTHGEITLEIDHQLQNINLGEYTFLYLSSYEKYEINALKSGKCSILYFHPHLLLNKINKVCCYIERIQDSLMHQKSNFLLDESLKTNLEQIQILLEIQTANNKTEFKDFFLEACGYKIIGSHLENQELVKSECKHMRKEDIQKMQTIRTLIEKNIQNPLSLNSLAKEAGTNVAYLKQHFKETFGTTVYGYTLQYRMEASKSLLRNRNYTITDVAFLVGYKHATHYTQAFKKYYGYLPSCVKKVEA